MTRGQKLRAAVAALGIGCALLPALGRADASDTTPPVLQALTLPAGVVTGPSGSRPFVTARITDDLSGVAGSTPEATCGTYVGTQTQVTMQSPTGNTIIAGFAPSGGDEFRATLELPAYAPPGTWTLSSVFLADCARNTRTLIGDELRALGFPTSFEVTGDGDATPPELSAFALAPTSVDVSLSGAQITATARLTDDLSGIALDGSPRACAPHRPGSAVVFRHEPVGVPRRVGFVQQAGDEYTATLDLPRFAAAGTWFVSSLQLVDCADNLRILSTDDLIARGFPVVFEVTGTSDEDPPLVGGLSIGPAVVDTGTAGADVTFRATVTDDLSGVAALDAPCAQGLSHFDVFSPSGQYFLGAFRLLSGDAYEATLSLPRFAEPGIWTVGLTVADCVHNTRQYASVDLAGLGLPSSFRVLPPAYDFGGFLNPLDADVMAHRKPGSAMAVKFTLGGSQGTDVFEPGFPKVQPIDCAMRQPLGDAASLAANQWVFQELTDGLYHYKWKSSPDWRNVCRRLILGFDDGSRYSADVRFG